MLIKKFGYKLYIEQGSSSSTPVMSGNYVFSDDVVLWYRLDKSDWIIVEKYRKLIDIFNLVKECKSESEFLSLLSKL